MLEDSVTSVKTLYRLVSPVDVSAQDLSDWGQWHMCVISKSNHHQWVSWYISNSLMFLTHGLAMSIDICILLSDSFLLAESSRKNISCC